MRLKYTTGVMAWLPVFPFVIRGVRLPATRKLLGEWNRCLPSRPRWLPTLALEGALRTQPASELH